MAKDSTLGQQRSERERREGPHDEVSSGRIQPQPLFVMAVDSNGSPSGDFGHPAATSATDDAMKSEQAHIRALGSVRKT